MKKRKKIEVNFLKKTKLNTKNELYFRHDLYFRRSVLKDGK